jgi:hypothetical protein
VADITFVTFDGIERAQVTILWQFFILYILNKHQPLSLKMAIADGQTEEVTYMPCIMINNK